MLGPTRPRTTSFERAVVRRGEDVEPAVVVVVPGPAGEPAARAVDAHVAGHVGEASRRVVVVEPGQPAQAVDEQVRIAIVVVVDPGAALVEFLIFCRRRRLAPPRPRTCRRRDCDTAGSAASRRRRRGRASRRCRNRPRRPRWN